MPMLHFTAVTLSLLVAGTRLAAQDPSHAASAADTLDAIRQDYRQAFDAFNAAYQEAKGDAERERASAQYPRGELYAARIAALVRRWPEDAAAVQATEWLLDLGTGAATIVDELLGVMQKHHLEDAALAGVCQALEIEATPGAAPFLRAVLGGNPHADVRGRACYSLAGILRQEAYVVQRLQVGNDPEVVAELTAERGAAGVAQMRRQDVAPLLGEAEARLEEVVERYASLPTHRGTLGQQARDDLFEMRHLAIGMQAPDIEGTDVDGVAFKLSDYRGKVVFLHFWGFW